MQRKNIVTDGVLFIEDKLTSLDFANAENQPSPSDEEFEWNDDNAVVSNNAKHMKKITNKTKAIIINSPHNPTGSVLSAADIIQLQNIVSNTGIFIISDEVYEHIVFDEEEHQSIARFPGLAERSFLVASFGKAFHNTGWKMGYCAGPVALMKEFRKVHQFNVFSVNHPVQKALATYLEDKEHYLSLPKFFQAKRDLFLDAIKDSKFSFTPSSGTYFQLLDFRGITKESDLELAKKWTREQKLASIPVSAFYQNPNPDQRLLRFCFAKNNDTLQKSLDILCRL